MIEGEAPYVTALALSPGSFLRSGKKRSPAPAALVAVPTPERVLVHLFATEEMQGKMKIARRMASIARHFFDEHERAVSPHVYVSTTGALEIALVEM
jgi:hypothetical protein